MTKSFTIPIYDAKARVVVCPAEEFEPPGGLTVQGDAALFYNHGNVIFWFSSSKVKPGAIAHECLHATNHILHWVGDRPTFEDDEPQAYLLGYLVEQVTKRLK